MIRFICNFFYLDGAIKFLKDQAKDIGLPFKTVEVLLLFFYIIYACHIMSDFFGILWYLCDNGMKK